jgi:hypothetical protein
MAKQRAQKELNGWREYLIMVRQKLPPEKYRANLAKLADGDGHGLPVRLRRAGEYFGLDPTDQIESKFLLIILAEILFPDKGRKKGTKEWDTVRLWLLASRVKFLEEEHPRWNDSRLAKEIYKDSPRKYKSWHAVRQRLASARVVYDTLPKRLIAELSERELRERLEALKSGRETCLKFESPTIFGLWEMNSQFAIEQIEKRLREIETKKPSLTLVK